MTEEVPIEEILCNALQYLSKLGSNLRTRSENLRDKKINKRKLKNSHAIKKAAKKVLLICELSKKSLDNVQSGVNRVLRVVEASQSSSNVGAKKYFDIKRDENNYQYFHYDSQKLWVFKSVPLNHYLSAKVLAEKMSTTIMDKYPVYCHCKLYRLRKKQSDYKFSKDNICEMKVTENDRQKISDVEASNSTSPTTREPPVLDCHEDEQDLNTDNTVDTNEDEVTDIQKQQSSEDVVMQCDSPTPADNIHCNDNTGEALVKQNNDVEKTTPREVSNSKQNQSPSEDNDSSTDKHIKFQFDDDSIDKKNQSLDEKKCPKKHKNENRNNSTPQKEKPVIKCVSLSKLLKPEVAKKICSESVLKARKEALKQNKIREKQTMLELVRDEALYWERKRKEVRAFTSKKFSIVITKLPNLTNFFLQRNQLKKITHNNNILCELENTTPSTFENSSTAQKSLDCTTEVLVNKTLTDEVKKVKHALLIESDSDSDISTTAIRPTKSVSNRQENPVPDCSKNSVSSDAEINTQNLPEFDSKNTAKPEDCQQTNKNGSVHNESNNSPSATSDANIEKINMLKYSSDEDQDSPRKISSSEANNINIKKKKLLKDLSDKNSNTSRKEISNNTSSDENDTNTEKINLLKDSSDEDTSIKGFGEKTSSETNPNIKKRNLLNLSDEDSNTPSKECSKNALHETNDTNIEKKNLLDSSDEGSSKLSKENNDKDALTPRSKSKKMSMHAKKMLLNYSSSENEDDNNLKNELNVIKKKLLKNASSSEDDTVQEKTAMSSRKQKSNHSDSSSSEDTITKSRTKAVKRKRIRNVSSSSSESNTTKKSKHSKVRSKS